MAADDHLTPGAILLGKYRVERVLGAGGMAVVVSATHLTLQDRVAIKVLLPEMAAQPEVSHRFLREAQAAVRLRGEHVARVVDVGALASGLPYIVMEHLDGHDLAAEIASRGVLRLGEAVDHVLQMCEAMAEAHALGIIHRDLKPANCFLSRRPDGSLLVKVLDFGISKTPVERDRQLTQTHAVIGTPAYMSPEQMRASRDVDARSDIWSLGVILYECITGRRPFDGDTLSAVCLQVAVDPLPPLPAFVRRDLAAVIAACLAKDPGERYPTVAALAAALAPYAEARTAAQAIVERTAAMAGGVAAAGRPAKAAPGSPTTLGGSAGVVPRRARPRAVIGVVVSAGVVAALSLAIVGAGRAPASEPATLAPAIAAPAPMVDAGTVDAGTVDAGIVDAGTIDAGTVDAGTVDARPERPDASPRTAPTPRRSEPRTTEPRPPPARPVRSDSFPDRT